MVDRLRVTELDFDTIKTNLKNFLKQQTEFQDYDFDGAGLSVLLDILAYNTHYNAYYLNMVANEAFLDTALLRDSVVSHAKVLGYTPYSTRSPIAVLNFAVETGTTTAASCTLPSGFSFLSNQIDSKAYTFVVLDDVTVTKSNTQFVFENLEIYEGQLITYNFPYNQGSNPKQIFTLPDENIDTTTLKVTVIPSSSNTASLVYTKAIDVLDITGESQCYFLQEERNGKYQIYFGNDVIGKALPDGAIVSVTYLVTNGIAANKANNFVATASVTDSLSISQSNFIITPLSAAAGGSSRETVDSIKFSAAASFSTQNRLITFKDYETYILNNYPAVQSISIWGGEDQEPKIYGKVFISIKPKNNYYISETEKQRIIDEIIKPKSIVSVTSEIIDPEYLYLIIEVTFQYDPKKTTSTEDALKLGVRNAILSYRDTYLDKFSSKIVDSKFEAMIDMVDLNSIIGNDLTIRAQKRFTPTLNETQSYNIEYNIPLHRGTASNKLISTEFDVYDNSNVLRTVILEEIPEAYTGISDILITNPGYGYTSEPTVTITGDGTGAEATATIVNGKIESIEITKRGINYSRAVVTISGGDGQGGTATAVADSKIGVLRMVYFDTNAERKIVDDNIGTINYDTGKITINDIKIVGVGSSDGQIRITIEAGEGIIESVKNTIITIDETDPASIVITADKL